MYVGVPKSQEEDVRQAQLVDEAVKRILDADPSKTYRLFVDVSAVSSWRYVASDSRNIYAGIVGHPQIARTAVLGSSMLLGVAARLIAQISGKSESLKFFDDSREALAWLKGD